MSHVHLTATITARPGMEDRLRAELARAVPVVRAEPGCIRYDLLRSADGADFVFYEIWADQAALETHAATEHLAEVRRRTADMVAGETAIVLMRAVDAAE